VICCIEAAASPIVAASEGLARLTTWFTRHRRVTKSCRLRVWAGAMDANEYEGDIQLQKAASGLLADFETSIQPFLWKTFDTGKLYIRRKVRVREKDRLLRLVCWYSFRLFVCGNMMLISCYRSLLPFKSYLSYSILILRSSYPHSQKPILSLSNTPLRQRNL